MKYNIYANETYIASIIKTHMWDVEEVVKQISDVLKGAKIRAIPEGMSIQDINTGTDEQS